MTERLLTDPTCMKTRATARCLLLLVATALAAAPASTLRAADGKAPVPAPAEKEKRAPLRLNVDRKPINRDAPDRVSYAGIVKRTAASVVYVYSTQKVKAPTD